MCLFCCTQCCFLPSRSWVLLQTTRQQCFPWTPTGNLAELLLTHWIWDLGPESHLHFPLASQGFSSSSAVRNIKTSVSLTVWCLITFTFLSWREAKPRKTNKQQLIRLLILLKSLNSVPIWGKNSGQLSFYLFVSFFFFEGSPSPTTPQGINITT